MSAALSRLRARAMVVAWLSLGCRAPVSMFRHSGSATCGSCFRLRSHGDSLPSFPPTAPAADRDNFMSPQQAIELGLIDGVIS